MPFLAAAVDEGGGFLRLTAYLEDQQTLLG
jgi:hypothetical protein